MLNYLFQKEKEREKKKQNTVKKLKKTSFNNEKSNKLDVNFQQSYFKAELHVSITEKDITQILKSCIGKELTIFDLQNYIRSFTHISYFTSNLVDNINNIDLFKPYLNQRPFLVTDTYERSEFLGDSILGTVVAEYIYNLYPMKEPGDLTKLRSMLVNETACIRYAKFLGLDEKIRIGYNSKQKILETGKENPKILEDVFEAFISGIYKDFETVAPGVGYVRARQFIVGLLNKIYNGDSIDKYLNDNYKDLLLQDFQNCGWPQPIYYDCHDFDYQNTFRQCVYAPKDQKITTWTVPSHLDKCKSNYSKDVYNYYIKNNFKRFCGDGPTKKDAQQAASAVALRQMEKLRRRDGICFKLKKVKFE